MGFDSKNLWKIGCKDKVRTEKDKRPSLTERYWAIICLENGPYWAIMGLGSENLWKIGGKNKERMRKRIKAPSLTQRLGYHGLAKLGLIRLSWAWVRKTWALEKKKKEKRHAWWDSNPQ